MLTVLPDKQNETAASKLLCCQNDGRNAGFVRFHHRGFILVIDELYPLVEGEIDPETFAVLDTIIRALGSYGLNHSCYYVECANPLAYPALERLRFTRDGELMKSNLKEILTLCGH